MIEQLMEKDNLKKSYLYESVAEKIEDIIISSPDMVGQKLPSEQAIADSLGISRNIVREAFKIIKERGLIEVKSGEGAFVSKPRSTVITKMLERSIKMNYTDISDIYEIRECLEVNACFYAATRINDNEIKNLNNLVNEMEKHKNISKKWAELDLQFHITIVNAVRNPLFYAYIKPLFNILFLISKKARDSEGAIESGIKGHKKILEALSERDPDKAKQCMHDHLIRSKEDIKSVEDGGKKEKNAVRE